MSFTTTQLQALERAIGTGQLEVQYDGKRVKYQSMSDLIAARNMIKQELTDAGQLAAPANTNRGPSTLAIFSRD